MPQDLEDFYCDLLINGEICRNKLNVEVKDIGLELGCKVNPPVLCCFICPLKNNCEISCNYPIGKQTYSLESLPFGENKEVEKLIGAVGLTETELKLLKAARELKNIFSRMISTEERNMESLEQEKKKMRERYSTYGSLPFFLFFFFIFPILTLSLAASSHGNTELFEKEFYAMISISFFAGIMWALLFLVLYFIKVGPIDRRIEEIRQRINDLERIMNEDLSFFVTKTKESLENRRKLIEQKIKDVENISKREIIKKRVRGFLVAYGDLGVEKISKRFKISENEAEEIIRELKSNQ